MDKDNTEIRRWHGRRPFTLDDDGIIDFLQVDKGMKVLDVGGADGYYAKKFIERGDSVTIIDVYDYGFRELNELGIHTIMKDFCGLDEGDFDMVFMAHVYHDLVPKCREKALKNFSKISPRYIGNLDFTKEEFGFGPPVSEKLSKEEVVRDMKTIGFKLKKDMDLPYHYLQLFEKE